jgi:hypothetical protein
MMGVSHCGLAIYIFLKSIYLKAKEELSETQVFYHAKIYIIFKKPLKETRRILQDIRTL